MEACGMCEVPRGSDRLLTVINNVERTHTHIHTHAKHPLPTFTQPHIFAPSLCPPPPPPLILLVLQGALVFCMMSSWGASVFGRRLCLSYEMKKMKKKKKKDGEKRRRRRRVKTWDPRGHFSPHCEDLPNSFTRGFTSSSEHEGYNHRSKQITYL